ncbi:MAG: nucleoside hydrolase [Anaerolineae bacterium]|nr:nucleoside hydrolase [Anaerolineae bacterium]MDW8172767.1 nucleoside hydrolase [Anaerolineae bacterium]
MPRKIIIDTDPGVDDSMAIFFALNSPELEVIGLTTIYGNVHTSLATTNALRLLEIAARTDIPVAQGANDPLAIPYGGPVPFVHGADGQGDANLPPPSTCAVDQSAAVFIIEQIMRQPGEVTLVPIGPLTNIALALRLEPRIAQRVREVVLMGGNALGPGNATPAAEANIHNDPEAADVVFGAPWQVTMVGLDVTHTVHMTSADLEAYARSSKATARHIVHILPKYRQYFEDTYGCDGIFVHDSSAIAYAIDPTLFTVQRWPVRVETSGLFSRGKTWPLVTQTDHRLPEWEGRPLVNVPTRVDGRRVVDLILSRI